MGLLDTPGEELEVYLFLIPREQPKRDKGVGMVEARAEKFSGMVAQLDDVSHSRLTPDFLHFVAEYPEVTMKEALVLVFLEEELFFHTKMIPTGSKVSIMGAIIKIEFREDGIPEFSSFFEIPAIFWYIARTLNGAEKH